MTSSAIAVSGLRKSFGDKVVLDGIDLDIPAGGVDSVGFHPQPVAVRLPLDYPFREQFPQPGDQALQGIRRIGGRALTPDPVDERRLRDYATWCECEGDQQPAQPGARYVGEAAVVRTNFE